MAERSRRLSALLLWVLMVTVTTAQSLIDPRSPSVARGIIGETAELACARIYSENDLVSWRRLRDHQILSLNRLVFVDDPRFRVRFNTNERTWFLDIDDSTKKDEGEYVCTVETLSEKEEKKVQLTLVEASDSLRWRPDSKCGHWAPLQGALSGQSAECDPQGAYPCCSSGGWCGFTQFHCDCVSCIDYRLLPTEATPTPAPEGPRCSDGYQKVSSKCLLYSKDLKTWSEATQYCASQGGRLITFDTLDLLMKVVENLTKIEMGHITSPSRGVPVWVGVSTRGHKDSNGGLLWRWVMGQSELTDPILLKHLDTADGERCGYLYAGHPIATIHHTGDCEEVLLPLCEQADD